MYIILGPALVTFETFDQPVLIYDNKCSPCWNAARIAEKLSRGRMRLMGHYESSDDLTKLKQAIFPPGYDPTSMSWLVNKNGAYGGRAWIVPLICEIIRGIFESQQVHTARYPLGNSAEENQIGLSCSVKMDRFERWSNFLRSSKRFTISKQGT